MIVWRSLWSIGSKIVMVTILKWYASVHRYGCGTPVKGFTFLLKHCELDGLICTIINQKNCDKHKDDRLFSVDNSLILWRVKYLQLASKISRFSVFSETKEFYSFLSFSSTAVDMFLFHCSRFIDMITWI